MKERKTKAMHCNGPFNVTLVVSDNFTATIFYHKSLYCAIPSKTSDAELSIEVYSLALLQSWQP